MPDIQFTVEGPTDRGAIKSVARRFRVKINTDLMYGNRVERLKGLIRSRYFDKYVIVKDLHRRKEESIRRTYNRVVRGVNSRYRNNIGLVIVKHEIEAWFLADIEALNRVYNCRINEEIRNPEDIPNPAEELDNLLRRYGKEYIKSESTASKIMEEVDLEKISEKAPSFRRFLDYLNDP